MKPRLGDRQTSILSAIIENKKVNISETNEYARMLHAKAKKNERIFLEDSKSKFPPAEIVEDAGSVSEIVMGAMNEDVIADMGGELVEKVSVIANSALETAFEENSPNYVGLEDVRDFDEEGVEEAEMIFVDAIVSAAYVYFESIASMAESMVDSSSRDEDEEDRPRSSGRNR